jgi:hypothetical protein
MRYVCDAPGGLTWFRIETEGEAAAESQLMQHAVEKFFRRDHEKAAASFQSANPNSIERDIGRDAHIQRAMPLFLTLRDREGNALVTAMLPPAGKDDTDFRIIIVGARNGDPYPAHAEAIEALGSHFALKLGRERCYPYSRYGA